MRVRVDLVTGPEALYLASTDETPGQVWPAVIDLPDDLVADLWSAQIALSKAQDAVMAQCKLQEPGRLWEHAQ